MGTESATIEFIYDGMVAPLTKLELAGSQPGKFDGGVYYSDGRVCEAGLQIKGSYRNEPAPLTADSAINSISGKFIFGGMLQNEHFGHFMAESLTRLWATRQVAEFDGVAFYLRNLNQPIAKFASETLGLLMPGVRVSAIQNITRFETLVVPKQLGDKNQGFIYGHPATRAITSRLAQIDPRGSKRIYVSRSKLCREGGILLEKIIEENLEKEGYSIIHPQEMSIETQIAHYRAADDIIFAEGSAIHLYALVARPEQRSFVIWRRKKHGSFDWQLQTFGARATVGAPSVRTLWLPEKSPHPVHGRAVLDFAALRDQLITANFIHGSSWRIPSHSEFEDELRKVSVIIKSSFIKYPSELLGQTVLT